MKSPYRIQQYDGRWMIISEAIKDDCPIVDDFATYEEAVKALAGIERERRYYMAPEIPLEQRGFGV